MKNIRMKKATALLLIFLLTFAAFGCGSKDDTDQPQDGDGTSVSDETGQDSSEDEADTIDEADVKEASYDEKVNEDTSDIDASDYAAEDMEATFDFGFSASKDLGMSVMLEQMNYSNLESLASDLETRMNQGISASLGGTYDVFSSYEPEEEDEIDDLVLAAAMENGEMESRYLEGGVFHLQSTGKYYHYLRFYTENFTEIDSSSLKTIRSSVKNAMGITLSESRLKKAVEIAYGNAKKSKDEYVLVEQKAIQGSGYTEKITVAVEGSTNEDNESCYYVCIERERCYQ
ncbi:MAG: hypothetical protein ACI4WY_05010 [Anaerovoracaceae bacterium]